MAETFELTNYKFYSSRLDMELISNIVDTLKEILEEYGYEFTCAG